MTGSKELYYAMMNIADYLALNNDKENGETLYKMLEELTKITETDISDIADANDCGECETWDDVVSALKELFKNGERG